VKSSCQPVFILSLAIALLAGCATGTAPTTGPVIIDRQPDYERGAGRPPEAAAPSPAAPLPYANLLQQATQAREAGEYNRALALLERAQRIDPGSADIYLALAESHRERGDTAQARATAERGLIYCAGRTQCEALRDYIR